jgi:large subunit ribosomal protein L6
MSRVAKKPINLPAGVKVDVTGQSVSINGPKGTLSLSLHSEVGVSIEGDVLSVIPHSEASGSRAQAGTARALLSNMVEGVANGFVQKLEIVGVGYRAQAKGTILSLTLGFSHPVE